MSADILILPIVRKGTDHDDGAQAMLIKLRARDYARLTKLAIEWNVTQDEAASMMLSDLLLRGSYK